MGMFDSVYVDCPHCDERIELQSKSGRCMLGRYSIHNVPMDVAPGVLGKDTCPKCEKDFIIEAISKPVFQIRPYDEEFDS